MDISMALTTEVGSFKISSFPKVGASKNWLFRILNSAWLDGSNASPNMFIVDEFI